MKSPCPMCQGRQLTTPHARIKSFPCWYCNGTGEVDPDFSCECGRPAVVQMGDRRLCCSIDCNNRVAAELKTKEASKLNVDHYNRM